MRDVWYCFDDWQSDCWLLVPYHICDGIFLVSRNQFHTQCLCSMQSNEHNRQFFSLLDAIFCHQHYYRYECNNFTYDNTETTENMYDYKFNQLVQLVDFLCHVWCGAFFWLSYVCTLYISVFENFINRNDEIIFGKWISMCRKKDNKILF